MTQERGTQKFQRAVSEGGGDLEDKVNAFFSDLAKPSLVPNDAALDGEVAREWRYEDIAERVKAKEAEPS
jgi:hypothetical protein